MGKMAKQRKGASIKEEETLDSQPKTGGQRRKNENGASQQWKEILDPQPSGSKEKTPAVAADPLGRVPVKPPQRPN